MTTNRTKLERLQRELDKRAPAEPVVIIMEWVDPWPDGEVVNSQEVIVGDPSRVIQLRWPEEEDEERTRQDYEN